MRASSSFSQKLNHRTESSNNIRPGELSYCNTKGYARFAVSFLASYPYYALHPCHRSRSFRQSGSVPPWFLQIEPHGLMFYRSAQPNYSCEGFEISWSRPTLFINDANLGSSLKLSKPGENLNNGSQKSFFSTDCSIHLNP